MESTAHGIRNSRINVTPVLAIKQGCATIVTALKAGALPALAQCEMKPGEVPSKEACAAVRAAVDAALQQRLGQRLG